MADTLISMVTEQFLCYVQEEFGLVVGVREEVGKLSLTLRMIQGVLQDAEQKQVKNSVVKAWLGELRDVLYEADDVMDKWGTEVAISRLQSQQVGVVVNPRSAKKVLSYLLCSCFKNVTVRYEIGHRIKKIGERLDDLNVKRNQFGLVDSPSEDQPRLITSSIIDVSKIHGRDQDAKTIVSKLLGESSLQETGVPVIAIVGMGGFGKTTLAKLVLKEEGVEKNFEKKMWVCVSEPFNLFIVAKAIIEQAEGEVPISTEWELMHQGLSKSVKGKRYLLILDDVWTKNPNHWDPLKTSLEGGAPGSRIIVTTRNEEVAKMMGSSHIHNLKHLSEGDSWSLVREIALKGRNNECHKFEKVGREIANRCKGVPLALSTLASLLRLKSTVQSWRDILASDLWGLAHIEDFFLPSLFLSYYSLPSVTKQCFLYCSVFPKDTLLEKNLLIKLWMAEGFLGSGRMGELEKVGEDHFDNLAMRSFFQDFGEVLFGDMTCKMHDLVHDFARYLSQGECSNGPKLDCDKVRYVKLEEIENSSLYEAKKVRTLLLNGLSISVELFSRLSCLRVLDLQWSKLEELPEAVEKLVHLRYLDLCSTRFLVLPETLCNLYNLQTLRLNYCIKLEKLPDGIGRLSNLRHLEMESTQALHLLPQSIKRLGSIRTLSKFFVSEGCKIGDLKHLNNLQGGLVLMGLGGITDESDAIEADLKKKKDLRRLTLDWEESEETQEESKNAGKDSDVAAIIFERLEPNDDLEELNIYNYCGSQFPCWFDKGLVLGNIVKLELNKCHKCTHLPALGKLGSLESLKILWMNSVKSIGHELYGFDCSLGGAEMIAFPKLKTLELVRLEELENWDLPISKDTKIMPLLCKLRLIGCPKLKALPHLGRWESLEELNIDVPKWVEELDSMPQEDKFIFPKLRKLQIGGIDSLEHWSSLFGKYEVNMMPSLSDLTFRYCPVLRVLPNLTKFKSLIRLTLRCLDVWEGQMDEEDEEDSMPSSFTELSVSYCLKLKVAPDYLFSPTLKELEMYACPELNGLKCFPSPLEKLRLAGDMGVYSKSFPVDSECSIRYVHIGNHPYSSLPEEIKNLKGVQRLDFSRCKYLDFELKELQHFAMLELLYIYECPLLEERFQGDDWRSILAHVADIYIAHKEITNHSS